jgi:hypothetical protein
MSDQLDRSENLDTDEGVPVGDADVMADIDRAGGGADQADDQDTDDFLAEGRTEMASGSGEAVGTADVEEDRRNAAGGE